MAVYTGKVNLINMSNITATAGVGIQRTEILYAISYSGVVPPDLEDVDLTTDNGIITFASTGASFKVANGILYAWQNGEQVPLNVNKDQILIGVSGWVHDFPEIEAGDYLWTKTIYYYTNDTQTITYGVSRQGEDGKQGPAGISSTAFKMECNQSEILKFIDKNTGAIVISPEILTVSIFKDDPSSKNTQIQLTNLDINSLVVEIYNISNGEWYTIYDPELITLEEGDVFHIKLQEIIDKDSDDMNLGVEYLRLNECIIKISYIISQKNESNETEYFGLVEYLNVRFGMSRDMASLNVKADQIVASMQDTKLVFSANGLSILNGNFEILKSRSGKEEDKLLYSENGNLCLKGTVYADSGSFKGHIEATSGYFSGELQGATGIFTGELKAASGSFAGDISAASGTIGGFKIEKDRLISTNEGSPNIILDGTNGNIDANNIVLGTGATIREYIKIGDQVELRKVNNSTDSFIRVTNDSNEILSLKADGTMKLGYGSNTIILSGIDGSITSQNYTDGLGWKISNTNSIFNDVTVRGSIRASVLEYGETQAIGGALLIRPSSRVLTAVYSDTSTVLTLEEIKGFNKGDFCRIDVQTSSSLNHNFYKIVSVSESNKQITVEGNASGATGKPIVNFGQNGDNVGISINGSIDGSFCEPQSISVFEFNSESKKIVPRIVLGKLPNQESIYGYAANSYGLYAENVLLKGSLVTQTKTENSGVMYSGISTVYSGEKIPKSSKLSTKIPNHVPSEILLWAGAEKDDQTSIEASKFFVDRNGNMYAGSGYFEGTIITDATIKASIIETTTLRGYGDKPALKIEDAAKGIYFTTKNEQTGTDDIIFEVNKDSIVANVPNFVFNSNFTVGGNGSLVVPNLYVIGSDTGSVVSEEYFMQAIMFDKKRITYTENFRQNELDGLAKGYIDFGNGTVFSPDGINEVMALSAQEVRIKGENTSLYLENSIKYGEVMEYKPVYEGEALIGYDLYIE